MNKIEELLKSSGLPRGEEATARKVYLHAGQLYASAEPTEIVTILGSCVSVCMFDRARGIGGLNHFMLPTDGATASPRYARSANEMLIAQLVALGASRSRLEAKIFGGASVLKTGDNGTDLGMRNVEAARLHLANENIPILGEDVGGVRGRKLLFFTGDGTALVKQV
ncbi:MAG TPA: chemotaxis protein CheD [Thermoanaerobaculia bacterium]|jgi:chemotaxis protein CheD